MSKKLLDFRMDKCIYLSSFLGILLFFALIFHSKSIIFFNICIKI